METYKLYPPQLTERQVPYEVVVAGAEDCQHELLENSWQERISVQDGVIFVRFSCRHCGRTICQSFDELIPPATWKSNGR
jgi:hypothetical protein